MNRGITSAQAKRFYDRFGSKQDSQGWYEDRAVGRMIERCDLDSATNVFELGFGTGRLAERLLRDHLSDQCTYAGREVSETMHRLASDRLRPWSDRVDLRLTDLHPGDAGAETGSGTGGVRRGELPSGQFDRYIATYVIDLMDADAIVDVFSEAHRVLVRGGLLCLVCLTHGPGPVSHMVSWLWERVQAVAPERVGGCRPISPSKLLRSSPSAWTITHTDLICRFGVCSEVCIAMRGSHAA